MGSIIWDREVAEVYDQTYRAKFEPSVLDPMVDLLAGLAASDGPALEFAVGTGRVALPLSGRGVRVHGIELSPHMAAQLRAKPGADAVPVTIGDMTTTRVPGGVLARLPGVQHDHERHHARTSRSRCSPTRPRTWRPGGRFVVEVERPASSPACPPANAAGSSTSHPGHVGIDTFDDLAAPDRAGRTTGRGRRPLVRHSAPYRYVWPSELDLMARLAGFRLRHRWAGWDRRPSPPTARARSRCSRGTPEPVHW